MSIHIILHNSKSGNNSKIAEHIAKHFQCDRVTAEDQPCLEQFDTIILVIPNWGDEELPQPMEDYLFNLCPSKKRYFICEIGNYFGLEDYCGCKRVASQILNSLGWDKVSDISLDSVPEIDWQALDEWLATCTS